MGGGPYQRQFWMEVLSGQPIIPAFLKMKQGPELAAQKAQQEAQKEVMNATTALITKDPDKISPEQVNALADLWKRVGMSAGEEEATGGSALPKAFQGVWMQGYNNQIAERGREQAQAGLREKLGLGGGSAQTPLAPNAPSPTPSSARTAFKSPEEIPYFPVYKQMAEKYNVPLSTALALHGSESSFDPNATSPTGVVGLGQVTKATTRMMGFDPAKRNVPEVSIEASLKYLRHLADTRGIDLNDPEQVVMNYTTEAGGATPKYIQRVAQKKQEFEQLLSGGDVGTAATPVQPVGTFQRPVSERLNPGESFHVDKDGNISATFSYPTMDQMSAQHFNGLSWEQQLQFMQALRAKQTGMEPQHGTFVNDLDGQSYSYTIDPATQSTTIRPLSQAPIKETPEQQRMGAARQQGMARQATALAGITPIGKTNLTAGQLEAEQRGQVLAEERKQTVLMPSELSDTIGQAAGISASIGEGFSQAAQALQEFKGAEFDIADLPTGLFEGALKKIAAKLGSNMPDSERVTNTIRNALAGVATQTAELLFALGGKNLTETEKGLVEDLRAGVELDPDVFVDRILNALTKVEYRAKGGIKTLGAQNIDTRGLEALLVEVQKSKEAILKYVPGIKRRLYERSGASEVSPQAPNPEAALEADWNEFMKGGE